jgi:hypothetical protein
MSLENNKNYTHSDAIYSLIEFNPNMTYEDYVRLKVEWYKSVFGDAKYAVDSRNYPCIILPWLNGSYDENFDLCIRFEQIADAPLSKESASLGTYISFGLYEQVTKKFTGRCSAQYNRGGVMKPTSIDSNSDAHYKVNTYGLDKKVISLGEFSNNRINPTSIPMNCMVAEFKKLKDDSPVNVVVFLPDIATADTKKYDNYPINLFYEFDGGVKNTKIYAWGLTQSPTCASMYQLNDGFIYSDLLFCCFPHDQSILQPLTIFDYTDTVNTDTWNKRCITVGGKQFSIKCAADNKWNGGNHNITIALLED